MNHKNSISKHSRDDYRRAVVKIPNLCGAPQFEVNERGKQQIDEIVDFVLKYFKSINPDDLIESFELCAAGQLDVQANTYGRHVTVGVVGQVLAAMNRKKQLTVKIEKPISDEPVVERPPASWHFDRMLNEAIETGDITPFHAWSIIVPFMVKKQMIQEHEIPKVKKYNGHVQSLADALGTSPERGIVRKWLIANNYIKNNNQ